MKKLGRFIVSLAVLFAIGPFTVAQQHGTISLDGVGTAGVHIKANGTTYPDVAIKTGSSTTGAFRVFNAADAELLRVNASGGVSTSGANAGYGAGGEAPLGYQFYAATATVGTSTALQLRGSYDGSSRSYVGNFGGYGTYISTNRDPRDGGFHEAAAADPALAAQVMIGNTKRHRLFELVSFPLVNGTPRETFRVVVDSVGRVGIGLEPPGNSVALLQVAGDVVVNGNIGAKYQDVAEWVPASSDLQPGTVVVLNPNRDNEVTASTRAYDTSVAGVVSEQPGLILGEASATKETIATMGRVRVRVDAQRAPIAIGDLLVTSDRAGYAMKSIPVDLAGMPMHRPGTIIGKALQPLACGEGEILVLLSLQ